MKIIIQILELLQQQQIDIQENLPIKQTNQLRLILKLIFQMPYPLSKQFIKLFVNKIIIFFKHPIKIICKYRLDMCGTSFFLVPVPVDFFSE